MINKIVSSLLNWAITFIVMPAVYYIWDYLRLKKIEKASKKAAKDLENAKTPTDIDTAIDNMP